MKLKAVLTALGLSIMCTTSILASDIKMVVDGQNVQFDEPPVVIDGTTYVPIRALLENVDNYITWEQSVSRDNTKETYKLMQWDDYNKEISYVNLIEDEYYHLVRIRPSDGRIHETLKILNLNNIESDISNGKLVEREIISESTLQPSAIIVNNRTLLPVRSVSELFKYDIDWDNTTKTITVDSNNPNFEIGNAIDENPIISQPNEVTEKEENKTVTEDIENEDISRPYGLPTEPPQVGEVLGKIVEDGAVLEFPAIVDYLTKNYEDGWGGTAGGCEWYVRSRTNEVHGIHIGEKMWSTVQYWMEKAEEDEEFITTTDPNDVVAGAILVYKHKTKENSGHVIFIEYVERDNNGKPTEVYFTDANGATTLEKSRYDHGYDGQVQKKSLDNLINRTTQEFQGYIIPKYLTDNK